MNERLNLSTALLLTVPPLLWAGNAVVGRLAHGLVPPMTLNLLRWALALLLLLPLAGHLLRPDGPVWRHWRALLLPGLLGVGCYNALLYLALKTSSPLNVTLVAASSPMMMLGMGVLFFGQKLRARQVLGALVSMAGVLLVLSRGELAVLLQLRLVAGDVYVLLATLAWAWYSWLLTRPVPDAELRAHWAGLLLAQTSFGLGWAALFALGEWTLTTPSIAWGLPLAAILLYVAVGPAILAYRAWGLGVSRVGPNVAAIFSNLTPLIAALLSTLFLGEAPRAYHLLAFLLIAGGIVVSSRR